MNKRARELFEQANYDIMLEERKLEIINEFNEYHNALIISTVEQLFENIVVAGSKVAGAADDVAKAVAPSLAGRARQFGGKVLQYLGIANLGAAATGGPGGMGMGMGGSIADPLTRDIEARKQRAKELADKNAQSAKDALARKAAMQRPSGQETIGTDTDRDRGEAATSRQALLAKAANARANSRERGTLVAHYVADVAKDVVKLLESEFDVAYDKQIIEQVIHIINENIDEEYVSLIMEMRRHSSEIADPAMRAHREQMQQKLIDLSRTTKNPRQRQRAVQALGTLGISPAAHDSGRSFGSTPSNLPPQVKLSPTIRQIMHPRSRNTEVGGREAREIANALTQRMHQQDELIGDVRKADKAVDRTNPNSSWRKTIKKKLKPETTDKHLRNLLQTQSDSSRALTKHITDIGTIRYNNGLHW